MSRYGIIFFLGVIVSIAAVITMNLGLSSTEVVLKEEYPKLVIKNPFWPEVSTLKKNMEFLLLIRDLKKISEGVFHRMGYITIKNSNLFEKALMEAIRITGKAPEVYEWERGKLFRLEAFKISVIYSP